MAHVSKITVCNNEGLLFDSLHRSTIVLTSKNAQIKYQDLSRPNSCSVAEEIVEFNDILSFIISQLESSLGEECSCFKLCSNENEYDHWRHTVEFCDTDVVWSIKIEYNDGKIAVFVSTENEPLPAALDQLELMVKETLEII